MQQILLLENLKSNYRRLFPALRKYLDPAFLNEIDQAARALKDLLCSEYLLVVEISICATHRDFDNEVDEKGLLFSRHGPLYPD